MDRFFPPIPPFEQAHPVVVHFPLALLIVAPVLLVLALVVRPWAKGLYLAALALVVMGTVGAMVAASTGRAAGETVYGREAVEAVLRDHKRLALDTRAWFMVLMPALAAMLGIGWKWGARLHWTIKAGAMLAYLVAHLAGLSLLSRAGHEGGRLVHELGVLNGMAGRGAADGAGEAGEPGTP